MNHYRGGLCLRRYACIHTRAFSSDFQKISLHCEISVQLENAKERHGVAGHHKNGDTLRFSSQSKSFMLWRGSLVNLLLLWRNEWSSHNTLGCFTILMARLH